ncbi:hypothetical protein JJD41_18175 [Oxynema sp. CENA135]|jgi:hypothetical protein|uniref:Uncharacterized protein n=1 Tax=Oxynema aestuarii AP17 TaxID=2064643 RepID=A0A6H1TZF7_9CYAN|nr:MULTISPECIES: hypothetical protein [Oxynema]MBK4731779.1 hypothetical protein [Oxynema sp. CENA135]QIZ70739.1 hypothetical protein HCG48_09215 [Oxynema aestuarii AP17]RMH71594.1 MAG: hypothetical protein D6680_21215 [Cyanobacteria bacterium J007]
MAKRRNLKKEKALRNEAYARKYRRRSNAGRFGKRRYASKNTTGSGSNFDRNEGDNDDNNNNNDDDNQ